MRSSSAAARRWSTPTTAAPKPSASPSATRRRSTASSSTAPRFVAARIGDERIEARACVLAAGGFESNREWLSEAWGTNERGERPAENFLIRGTRFNTGVLLKLHARCRRRPHRRSDPGAHGGDRRPGAALRRRHLHPDRLRLARRRRQPRRRALLRRGRGLLAEALRDLGPAGRGPAGTDRLVDHRCQGDRPVHAAGLRRHARRRRCRSWRARSACPRPPSSPPSSATTPPAAAARSTTPPSTTAAPPAWCRPRATGPGRSTRRPSSATRCARA